MISPLASHRSNEDWTWDLLDLNDNFISEFAGVTGGLINKSVAATIRTGGKLSWAGMIQPEWTEVRVRPTYHATLVNGLEIHWPMGVFIPSASPTQWHDGHSSVDVELYDKLLVLDEDKVDVTYTVAAGSVVTTAVRTLITSAGEEKHSIVDSTDTIASSMAWQVGTTKLQIINDLLASINYFSLWCDSAGFYRGEPYVHPAYRGTAWQFFDDEWSIYSPAFEFDSDFFGKPNKVVLVSQGDDDTAALTSTASNTNSADPLSYPRRQRWIVYTETGVEATSQTVLDGLAVRRLADLSQMTNTLTIEHALVQLELNDIIEFRRLTAALDIIGAVQNVEIPCKSGGLVKTVIRQVK